MITDGRQLTLDEEVSAMPAEQLAGLLKLGEHLLDADRAWYRWDRARLREQVETYRAEIIRRRRASE